MKIVINYDSVWQTSFLEPHDDNVNKRKFVATSGTKGETPSPLSDSTVYGVLNRLIGEQRKLSEIRRTENYVFKELESRISWKLARFEDCNELVYLTNKSDDRCAQSTWLGVIPDDCPWFSPEFAEKLWGVLYLNHSELLEFIRTEGACYRFEENPSSCDPKSLLRRVEMLADKKEVVGKPWMSIEKRAEEKAKKEQSIEKKINEKLSKKEELNRKNSDNPPKTPSQRKSYESKIQKIMGEINELNVSFKDIEKQRLQCDSDEPVTKALEQLSLAFPSQTYWKNGYLYPLSLYAAALYIRAAKLTASADDDYKFLLNAKGDIQIQGFSKSGFNGVRDWLNPLSGKRRKAVGTPCNINKQSGVLEIVIDVSREKACEINDLIQNAGVSAFYLGKKGLAYVADIRI